MIIEEALYTHVTSNSGFAALASARLYPMVIPQDAALPAVAYQRISGVRVHDMQEAAHLAHPRYQFTVVASSYSNARAVVNALRTALVGYMGTMGGAGGVRVMAVFCENEIDNGFDQASGRFTIRIDFIVWHYE